MSRLPFASFAAAAALAVAAFAGPVIASADGGAAVSIHEGGDVTSWGYTATTTTIQAGQTVTWTNAGVQPHDANSTDGTWQVPLLNNGESASYTFTTPGTYTYICTPHPWMQATIVVTAAAAAPSDAGAAPADTSAPPADAGSGG